MTFPSRHVRSLLTADSVYSGELGSITRLTADNFPILNRLSIKRLVLAPGVIREPHWHANANELGYCLSGSVLVTILDSGSAYSSFTISAGQMFHIETGALHAIENIGADDAELIITFSNERPEDFSLHAAFGAMSDAVLGNTFGLPAADFAPLVRDTTSALLVKRAGDALVPDATRFINPHKFDLGAQTPPLDYPYANARTAKTPLWPALQNVSMFSITIEEDGMREPHWHPNTAEMGYVHKGHARMTILDPDGSLDTYLLEPGDTYFIPRAYPHQIEVIGDDEIHFLVFFDQPVPGDVGYRLSASAFSRQTLAATFGVSEDVLPQFPVTSVDPLLVSKPNPTDPV